jgi:excisionase family DNA binding protein
MNITRGLKEWNTMQEVAEYLRLSLRTVERRIRNGVLQARKDGSLVRIKREWVLSYETADLL